MIARLRQWTTDLRCAIVWAFAAVLNLATVFTGHGDWVNLALAAIVGALATHSYRSHVRDQEDRQAVLGRGADIDWWRSHLESDSVSERQAAVELLTYWGVPVTVDPLEEPGVRERRSKYSEMSDRMEAARRRRDAYGLDPAEVQAKARLIVSSGRDLAGVIELRQRHEQAARPNSPLWIAACKLLEGAAAEQAGYTQDFDEVAVRSVGGGVSAVYRHPDGPTPREQMLAEFQRAKEELENGTRAAFTLSGPVLESGSGRISRDLPRSYLMSQKIHDRR